jgi:hypothetical protein
MGSIIYHFNLIFFLSVLYVLFLLTSTFFLFPSSCLPFSFYSSSMSYNINQSSIFSILHSAFSRPIPSSLYLPSTNSPMVVIPFSRYPSYQRLAKSPVVSFVPSSIIFLCLCTILAILLPKNTTKSNIYLGYARVRFREEFLSVAFFALSKKATLCGYPPCYLYFVICFFSSSLFTFCFLLFTFLTAAPLHLKERIIAIPQSEITKHRIHSLCHNNHRST